MEISQTDFVLSISTDSPAVISIPHEGLYGGDVDAYYTPRPFGLSGREQYLCAIAGDANRGSPVASLVRGLLPRSLCDYNRPTCSKAQDHAVFDGMLVRYYEHYHNTIALLLIAAHERHGSAFLLDLHGFCPERSDLRYDLVLGSCNGTTAPGGLGSKALEHFSRLGYAAKLARVGEKFSGGYTVAAHARAGISALQLEVSKRFRRENSMSEGRKLSHALRTLILSLR